MYIEKVNKTAKVLKADLELTLDNPKAIKNKRALVIEDGPTITHGEMPFGAGFLAAKRGGVKAIIDPRPYLTGSLKNTFKKYPHIGKVLPALGYGRKQVRELQDTINKCPCDIVISGTPIDLNKLITLKDGKSIVRVNYKYTALSKPGLKEILKKYL